MDGGMDALTADRRADRRTLLLVAALAAVSLTVTALARATEAARRGSGEGAAEIWLLEATSHIAIVGLSCLFPFLLARIEIRWDRMARAAPIVALAWLAFTLMHVSLMHGLRAILFPAALGQAGEGKVETIWSGAGPMPGDEAWSGGTVFEDARQITIGAPPGAVFAAVRRVGGGNGWYAADWLWRVRGAMDRVVGGPGLRRGRRDPEQLAIGEALDFWRVVGVREPRSLDLVAEMKLPGEARLSFEIEPLDEGRSRLRMVARFAPKGLMGLAYWYAVLPLHGVVFRGMLNGIRRAAEDRSPAGEVGAA